MPFRLPNLKKKPQEPDHQLNQFETKNPTTISDSKSTEKTDALKAFRTITSMLSLMQPTLRKDTADGESDLRPGTSRKTLSILNVLAVVGSREHAIAAAVVGKDDGSGTTQVVITCFNHNGPLIVPQETSSGIRKAITYFFTVNPRSDYPKDDGPINSDPETAVPQHLKDQANDEKKLLATFIKHDWPKYHSKSKAQDSPQSFAIHTWMLTKVIIGNPRTFAIYVIATCYLRIIRRLNYRISESFCNALKKLRTVEFSDKSHMSTSSETANDLLFLAHLSKIEPLLVNKIPNLMQHLHDSEFYTNKTCTEFHLLLCELLEKYSEYLEGLKASQKKPASTEDTFKRLESIVLVGTVLRLMVRGGAIKKHLKVIENFLPNSADFEKQKLGDGGNEDDDDDKDKDKEDEEFTALNGDKPPWKTCFDWLELMVVHFDAIQTLGHFIEHHPTRQIKIKILSQQRPSTEMLTWRELLTHKKHFPTDLPGVTAQDLITFLEPSDGGKPLNSKSFKNKPNRREDVVELLKGLQRFDFPVKAGQEEEWRGAIDNIIHHIGLLTNCTSAGSSAYTENIVEALQKFRNACLLYKRDEAIAQITTIASMVKTLRANARLRASLGVGLPLDTGRDCKSDNHCEGCLATFCTYGIDGFGLKKFISEPVVGVSKRCCPICAYLLKLLNPKFDFTAMHSIISPYSLPDQLPMEIIASMITKFGGQLREELASLKERTKILETCDGSIHSQGLSDSGSAHTFFDTLTEH